LNLNLCQDRAITSRIGVTLIGLELHELGVDCVGAACGVSVERRNQVIDEVVELGASVALTVAADVTDDADVERASDAVERLILDLFSLVARIR